MPQVNELSAVALEEVDSDDLQCPFEHKKIAKVKNNLVNSSEGLGTNLANGWSTQLWAEENGTISAKEKQRLIKKTPDDCKPPPIMVDDSPYQYSSSAHHLIPGDASLAKSELLEFIKADASGSTIGGDIGYDVNGAENGVWLPTHHALSNAMSSKVDDEPLILPGETKAMKYSALSQKVKREGQDRGPVATFQERYTFNVMDRTERQFHDSHQEYSAFVIKVLSKIHVNLSGLSSKCKPCGESRKNSGKLMPPYKLVIRLNDVSSRLRPFLLGAREMWRTPLYTSRFAAKAAEMQRGLLRRFGR